MRPKKIVLCLASSQEALSRRVFQLETWGYRVIRAATPAEALLQLTSSPWISVDVMVVDVPVKGLDHDVLRYLREPQPEMKVVMVGAFSQDAWKAEVCLPPVCPPAELRERIAVLMARKRGPKPARAAFQTIESREGVAS